MFFFFQFPIRFRVVGVTWIVRDRPCSVRVVDDVTAGPYHHHHHHHFRCCLFFFLLAKLKGVSLLYMKRLFLKDNDAFFFFFFFCFKLQLDANSSSKMGRKLVTFLYRKNKDTTIVTVVCPLHIFGVSPPHPLSSWPSPPSLFIHFTDDMRMRGFQDWTYTCNVAVVVVDG